jgi:hypothetical protein
MNIKDKLYEDNDGEITIWEYDDDDNTIMSFSGHIMDELGFCACGSPEETIDFIAEILKVFKWYADSIKDINDNLDRYYDEKESKLVALCGNEKSVYFIKYFLDSKRFLEHGGSIGGSWITSDGLEWLELYEFATSGNLPSLQKLIEGNEKTT